MVKKFEINGKTYIAQEFDFNTICDLEECGIEIDTMFNKPTSLSRAYLSICSGMPLEIAGNEIQEHVKNGGTLTDILDAFSSMVNESDFFRSIQMNQEKKNTKTTAKKVTEK